MHLFNAYRSSYNVLGREGVAGGRVRARLLFLCGHQQSESKTGLAGLLAGWCGGVVFVDGSTEIPRCNAPTTTRSTNQASCRFIACCELFDGLKDFLKQVSSTEKNSNTSCAIMARIKIRYLDTTCCD